MIFALHTLRLVGLGEMVIKPKQSSFPLTKNLKSTSQSSIRRSLSTNLKFATLKRWNCMPQTLQSVVDFCFSVIWIERLMWRGKSKTWLLQCTIAVTFVHPHVNVRVGFLYLEAMDLMQIEEQVFAGISESRCCRFTTERKQVIENQLPHLRASLSEGAYLLSPDHSLGFTTQSSNKLSKTVKLWTQMFLRKQMSGMPVWHKKSLLFLATLMNNLRKLDLDFLNLVWHRFWNQNILF